MNYKPIMTILCSFIIVCCTKKQVIMDIHENGGDSLSPQLVENIELWCSDEMTICDSTLVIIDGCQEKKLYFFQLKDFSLLKNIGNTGNGPEDFLYPFFLFNNNSLLNELSLYDVNLAKIKTIKMNYLLNDSSHCISTNRAIPSCLIGSPDMAQIDNTYYGSKDLGLGMFFTYSSKDKMEKWVPYPPSVSNNKEEIRFNINQSRITVNHKKKLIVAATRFYNQLFLYNSNGELLRSGTFGKKINPEIENKKISTSSDIFFTHLYSTDKYIYVVMTDEKYRDNRLPSQRYSKIAIFDWNLNHIKTLYSNKHIYSVVVDTIYNRLLLLCMNDDREPELYYDDYDESKLLETI